MWNPSVGDLRKRQREQFIANEATQSSTLVEIIEFLVRLSKAMCRMTLTQGPSMAKPPPADEATTCALRDLDACRGCRKKREREKKRAGGESGLLPRALSRSQQAQSHAAQIVFKTAD